MGGVAGGGGVEGKALYFLGGVCGAVVVVQSSGRLAFVKMYHFFAGGGPSQKCSSVGILCSNGIFWNEKKNDEQTKSRFSVKPGYFSGLF